MLGELDLNMPTLTTRFNNPSSPLNNIRNYLGYYRLPHASAHLHRELQFVAGLGQSPHTATSPWDSHTPGPRICRTSTNDRGTSNTYTWDPKMDYGHSGLNQPQIFVGNFVYKAPFFREQSGFAGHTLGGWELSGIVSLESGLSFSDFQYPDPFGCVADTTQANGCAVGTYPGGLGMDGPDYDILSRPDQVAPVHLTKSGLNWFDTSGFATAQGHFGSEHAGSILSPGFEKVDLGLMKNFRFTERMNLQMRAEAFNVFNHTNFDSIDGGLGDGTFGQAVGAHEGRKMQFSGKLYF